MTPTTLFLDVGGVLLTNGWDHLARRRAAIHFKLKRTEMAERHRLNFETHQEGKVSFEDYLGPVAFYQERPFTRPQFKRFMFAQSQPNPGMIEIFARLKIRHGLQWQDVRAAEAAALFCYQAKKWIGAFTAALGGLNTPVFAGGICARHGKSAGRGR